VLDGIHEDMNCIRKISTESVFGDGTNDVEAARLAWERHLKRNKSPIVDIFHGQLRSRLECPECRRLTVVFDPYVAISVPIAPSGPRNVSAVFVPLDFAAPRIPVNVPAIPNVSAEVSAQIGRSVTAVLFSRARNSSWISCGVSDMCVRDTECWAFEIRSQDMFYAPCYVEMLVQEAGYTHTEDVSGLFLVEVARSPTEEDVAKAASRVLECVWTEKVEPDRGFLEKMKTVKLPTGEVRGTERVTARFERRMLWSDSTMPCISTYITALSINPPFVTEESGFSLASLMRHRPIQQQTRRTSNSLTLEQCLEWFSVSEILDEQNQWYCPSCRQFVCAKKRIQLWSVPRCLIIHLKRFTQYIKLDTFVEFPNELDITPYVVGTQASEGRLVYRLYAVSNHYGGLHGGHYTAAALVIQPGKSDGKWYSFDDSCVRPAEPEDVHSKAAYVLYYERVEKATGLTIIPRSSADEDSDDSPPCLPMPGRQYE
jgi:ubiquitin carboxyl-terminal hydrolase 4/11/15